MLAVAPANTALGSTVTFTATGVPPNASATFSPSSLPAGTKSTNVALSITTAPHTSEAAPLLPRAVWPQPLYLWGLAFLIASIWFWAVGPSVPARRYAPQFLVVLLLLIATALAACGGPSSNSAPQLNPQTGTPGGEPIRLQS